MKIGWVVITACAGALVALVWVVRWQTAPVSDEAAVGAAGDIARSRDAARPGEGDLNDPRRAAVGGARHAADGAAAGGGKRPAGSAASGGEASGMRRLADVVRNARSGGGDGTSMTDAETGTLPDDGRVQPGGVDVSGLPHARADAQGADGHEAQGAEREAVENAPEPVPDVVYEGGAEHRFETESQVEVSDAGKISGEAGTISFWLNPQWPGGDQADATFVQLGDSGMRLVKNVDFLRFEYIDGTGAEKGLGINIGGWNADEWHQVAGTWGNGTWALYVDGRLVSQQPYAAPPSFPNDTRLYVGSNYPEGVPVAPGDVSSLTVLNRISSADEVTQQFQSGAPQRR